MSSSPVTTRLDACDMAAKNTVVPTSEPIMTHRRPTRSASQPPTDVEITRQTA